MRKTLFLFIIALFTINASAQWKPAGDKIKTDWAGKIDPNNVWPEYPRPIMERTDWSNLNGLWEYAILPKGSAVPSRFQGNILVPFCVESSLSGVQKQVGENNELWYKRTFTVPFDRKDKKILLHFGAVDWKADVWINDILIGSHTGGYTPFNFDIAPYLTDSKEQTLIVRVWDPTDRGPQARGKQVNHPNGIWYTPVTGIWQTVWLEPVSESYISDIRLTPDIDSESMSVGIYTENNDPNEIAVVKISDGNKLIASGKSVAGNATILSIPSPKLWSPESPFLYGVEIELYKKGVLTDKIKSYCAMRKVSTKRDANDIIRIQLNNKDYFQFGPLDQGWWPDGLYTAPCDEALKYDIIKTKEWGFNMLRKHVKVEPARFYTHCDQLGILVWQDMPNGDVVDGKYWKPWEFHTGEEFQRSERSEKIFRKEWKEIMDFCYNYPCISTWVPFNEAWGQFKTVSISEWTKDYDPSRLVNAASGGNHFQTGDMIDVHHYPQPHLLLYDTKRACVMGEYGGIGLVLNDHLWVKDRNWGYVQFKTPEEVTNEYVKYADILKSMVSRGISAGVYTQTTDVEIEVNGLMTYDRKVVKINPEKVKAANTEVINSLNKQAKNK